MMCISDGDAGLPLRFASITRRQISTVTWSPRSLAASRTAQTLSCAPSGFAASDAISGRWRRALPKEMAVPAPLPKGFILRCDTRRLARRLGSGIVDIPARLIEFQDAAGRFDIEACE